MLYQRAVVTERASVQPRPQSKEWKAHQQSITFYFVIFPFKILIYYIPIISLCPNSIFASFIFKHLCPCLVRSVLKDENSKHIYNSRVWWVIEQVQFNAPPDTIQVTSEYNDNGE